MNESYFFACLVMGLGIGMDVAIATFMRAHSMENNKVAFTWVAGVSMTHTLFPMLGYLLTYYSLQLLPILTPFIGMLAFFLILHFLYGELKEEGGTGEFHNSLISIGLILAVSWDALWSGPAKSAQVVGWSNLQIWASFILVGLVVTVFSLGSLYAARKLSHVSLFKISFSFDWGAWIQYSVIGYFGLLAFSRYTLSIDLDWPYLLTLSFVIMYAIMRWQYVLFRFNREAVHEL